MLSFTVGPTLPSLMYISKVVIYTGSNLQQPLYDLCLELWYISLPLKSLLMEINLLHQDFLWPSGISVHTLSFTVLSRHTGVLGRLLVRLEWRLKLCLSRKTLEPFHTVVGTQQIRSTPSFSSTKLAFFVFRAPQIFLLFSLKYFTHENKYVFFFKNFDFFYFD